MSQQIDNQNIIPPRADRTNKKKKSRSRRPKGKVSESPKTGSNQAPSAHKVQTGDGFTDITIGAHLSSMVANRDCSTVTIDTRGVLCQLWEKTSLKIVNVRNYSEGCREIIGMMSAIIAIIENICLGAKFSDLPSQVVEMFPKVRVHIPKDLLHIVHMTAIPRGKIYVNHANISVGNLYSMLCVANPTRVTNMNELNVLKENINMYFNQEMFTSTIITPSEGRDEFIALKFCHNKGNRVAWDHFCHTLSTTIYNLNAMTSVDDDYVLYNPVLCEQKNIAFLDQSSGESVLVTFEKITTPETLERLKIATLSVRFYVSFIRVYRDMKCLVDHESIEDKMSQSGLLPIYDKYGYKVIRQMKMMEEDDRFEVSMVEGGETYQQHSKQLEITQQAIRIDKKKKRKADSKKKTSNEGVTPEKEKKVVPTTFNFSARPSKRWLQFVKAGCVVKLSHFTKPVEGQVLSVCSDGMVFTGAPGHGVGYSALVREETQTTNATAMWYNICPDEKGITWSESTLIENEEEMAQWVTSLPALPTWNVGN
jgi:hypothetical protein